MQELNGILGLAQDYSLNFGTVDASQTIVRRQISLSFTTSSYASAKEMLNRLHNSAFRCILNDISISLGRRNQGRAELGLWQGNWDGKAAVNGTE